MNKVMIMGRLTADPELKNCAAQLLTKHQELFERFFRLV